MCKEINVKFNLLFVENQTVEFSLLKYHFSNVIKNIMTTVTVPCERLVLLSCTVSSSKEKCIFVIL